MSRLFNVSPPSLVATQAFHLGSLNLQPQSCHAAIYSIDHALLTIGLVAGK